MQRIVSILFLFLLPAVTLQPVLAFHFCGGSFQSAGIGRAGNTCCEGRMDALVSGGFRHLLI